MPAPTAPTPNACTRSRAGSIATMLADRTAASAGLSPPHACKQRPWELHLVGSGILRHEALPPPCIAWRASGSLVGKL